MSGPQFIHLQTFSRKPNPAGQHIDQIFGELTRDPEYSHHLEDPEPPVRIDGLTPEDLVRAHDKMIEGARVEVKVKGKVKHRAVRKDRHTLMTAIASYPLTWDVIKGDPKEEAALKAWEAHNVAFFKKLYGPSYKATYRHTDEPYPHLHIYALPESFKGVDATKLHPGKFVKAREEAKAKAQGQSPRESVKVGNKALKDTMRKFQNLYFEHVGEPCGLLRIGPRRQRLSRKDYQAQKEAARLRSVSTLEARDRDLKEQRESLAKSTKLFQERYSRLRDVSQTLKAKQDELQAREAKIIQASDNITACIKHLRGILDTIGGALGLGTFKSVRDGLDKIGGTALSLRNSFRQATQPPQLTQDQPDL